jgi:uncharacterized integral membrane protein
MSTTAKKPEEKPEQPAGAKAPRRTRREQTRTAGLMILSILITLFAVLNLNEVKVDWAIGSGHAPLIIVIVISVVVGVALGHFAERRAGKRR